MICPYNRKQEKYFKQYKNDLINEDTGIIKGYTEGYVVKFELMECVQENCGAWQDGKCKYNQGVNG
jgi:hypothetical protein